MKVTAATAQGAQALIDLTLPDTCPICNFGIEATVWRDGCYRTDSPERVQIVLRCPRDACQELFIATYRRGIPGEGSRFLLKRVAPKAFRPIAFPRHVTQLSPRFVKVFNQASDAEAGKLDEIAGMGYRKSLEYLIKDFAISRDKAAEAEIKKQMLGTCITNYISDPTVQNSARRAAWLGNDETHYVRMWEDKDVNDLKLLISLAVNAIENILLAEHYEKEMPARR